MTTAPRRLATALAAIALTSAALLAGTAGASASSALATQGVTTFGVRPATATGADSTRTFFSYTAGPGRTIKDQIYVTNYSDTPLTLGTYAADAYNNADGGYNTLLQNQRSQDLGGWIRLRSSAVTVPPNRGVVVPFTFTVPANAAAGDHAAGVLVSLERPAIIKGNRVLVEQRVGARVYLRVPGELKPSLQVQNFTVAYGGTVNPLGGAITIEYDVRNTGNVRLSADQSATVGVPLLGTRKGDVTPLRDLLPGGSAHVRVGFVDVPPLGPLTTRASVDPVPAAGTTDAALPSVVRTATPWGLFWILLLAVAAIAVGVDLVRRRRAPGTPPPAKREEPVPVP